MFNSEIDLKSWPLEFRTVKELDVLDLEDIKKKFLKQEKTNFDLNIETQLELLLIFDKLNSESWGFDSLGEISNIKLTNSLSKAVEIISSYELVGTRNAPYLSFMILVDCKENSSSLRIDNLILKDTHRASCFTLRDYEGEYLRLRGPDPEFEFLESSYLKKGDMLIWPSFLSSCVNLDAICDVGFVILTGDVLGCTIE